MQVNYAALFKTTLGLLRVYFYQTMWIISMCTMYVINFGDHTSSLVHFMWAAMLPPVHTQSSPPRIAALHPS